MPPTKPHAAAPQLAVLIVTGQSGSGKSTALRALEDQGHYCVDNLPSRLVEDLITLLEADARVRHLALGIDVREGSLLAHLPQLIGRLRGRAGGCRVLFLQSSVEALVRRYTTTRRWHPLDSGGGLRAAIDAERDLLAPLDELADDHLDTSELTPHDLRHVMMGDQSLGATAATRGPSGGPGGPTTGAAVAPTATADSMRVGVVSFGFKYGVPAEANLLFDVRFLPNPYFDPSLRPHSGLAPAVRAAVMQAPEAEGWLRHAEAMMAFALPLYQQEGKRYLHIAVGCTGGRHRSVALAVALAARLEQLGTSAFVRHRDIHREGTSTRSEPTRTSC